MTIEQLDTDFLRDQLLSVGVNAEWLEVTIKNAIVDDTTYINSIPGLAETIKRGMATPLSECEKINLTKEMLGIEEEKE